MPEGNGLVSRLLIPEIKELIEQRDWRVLKDILCHWPVQDIADILGNLNTEDAIILFRLLPKRLQSAVFSEIEPDMQLALLQKMTDERIREVLAELSPDDRTELFEELPGKVVQKLLNLLPPEDRKESLKLLGFPENSVGRLMTSEYVALRPYWTVERAMKHIRRFGIDAETIDMVYVVDDNWRLLDDVPLRRIILADPKWTIEAVMDHRFISIEAHADQEEAVRLMKHYDLIALPVTDSAGVLLGIVTIDDVIDVLEEEHTEDFTKVSAIETHTVGAKFITKLREIPLRKIYRSRVTWLLTLLIMDLVTGGIIQGFEKTIAKYVVLVTFLPVLVDTAGNAGSQSATLVIRSMALGTIQMRDWLYLLRREFLIAGALGVTMGLGISVMGIVRGGSLLIAQVVVLAMIVNVIVGCTIGVLLPFIFARFKKDPAAASTPLITTLADILGTAIYLGIAYMLLG